jgi:peptidoglycan/LPS O-acetylase OafA/YrhL
MRSSTSGVEITAKARSIPSLDGLRAISILLVVIAHSSQNFSRWVNLPVGTFLLFAHLGVSVFFVISGFLITSLLLKEWDATGTIGLKRFYLRRAFRIFPPFYLYLVILLALVLAGVFHTSLRAFFFAAIYCMDYYLGPGSGFVGLQHIWSLSVEEQFYLLWPAALLLLGKRKAVYLAGFLILISPLLRGVTYLILEPQHRAMINRMFHSSVDTIMFGCLLALLWQNDRFRRWLPILTSSWLMAGSVFFLFLLDPLLESHFYARYSLLFGMTLEGIAISLVTLYVVKRPDTLYGRVLNTPILRHIGVISYSLYLWQSILTAEAGRFFPFNLAAILLCAELSYWAVERPSQRLRDRLWTKKMGAPAFMRGEERFSASKAKEVV